MDEDDTCRICRSGPEEDAPLYHPCRCSGSIAKVHQDCLIEWLQHSRKKTCELCYTELRFHKVYAPSMPSKLPAHLYARRFFLQSLYYLRLSLRAMIVATAWLALLPLGNIYIWRLHFWIVDVLIWGIIGGSPPSTQSVFAANASKAAVSGTGRLADNASSVASQLGTARTNISSATLIAGNTTAPFPLMPFERLAIKLIYGIDYKRVLDNIAHDTFEGQILTCVIVVVFVAIFLLREWCMQNLPQQIPMLDLQPGQFQVGQQNGVADAGVGHAPNAQPRIQGALEEARRHAAAAEEARRQAQERIAATDASQRDETDDARTPLAQPLPRVDSSDDASPFTQETRVVNDDAVDSREIRARRTGFLTRFNAHAAKSDEEASTSTSLGDYDGNEGPFGDCSYDASGKDRETNGHSMQAGSNGGPASQADKSEAVVDEGKGKGRLDEDFDGELSRRNGAAEGSPSTALPTDPHESVPLAAQSPIRATGDDDESDITDSANISVETLRDVDEDLDEHSNAGEIGEGPLERVRPVAAAHEEGALDLHDWEDDVDNGERLEDDIEGMMEAIGMRGPFANLVTNITLMFVLCSFTLTVSVALPYTLGRLIGMGHVVPRVLSLPFQALHAKTRKTVVAIASDSSRLQRLQQAVSESFLGPVFAESGLLRKASLSVPSMSIRTKIAFLSPKWLVASGSVNSGHSMQARQALSTSIEALQNSLTHGLASWLDRVYAIIANLEARTNGTTSHDRVFCTMLGHVFWLAGLAIQHVCSNLYVRFNMPSLKTFVDQQIVVLKVLFFVMLELVCFPLYCGILTDISLFPLWENASLSGRLALAARRPITLAFAHWALGTLYMFVLAQFVGLTRNIMRPGVLCFVRDPGDPNFQPIKHILERQTVDQLRKIGVSGLLYSVIMASTVGISSHLVAWATNGLLPLHWDPHHSLTSTGFELVAIAVNLPWVMEAWLSTSFVGGLARGWWCRMAHVLRLSWYLLGDRKLEEEGHPLFLSWTHYFKYLLGITPKPRLAGDGFMGRVPGDDHAIMSTPLIILTDDDGRPINERGADALHRQEEAMEKMTQKPSYRLVYIPPHFRLRITALMIALWGSVCAICIFSALVPLIVGRAMISRLAQNDSYVIHDGLAWTAGLLLILSTISLVTKTQRMYRRLKVSSNAPRRFSKHIVRFLQRMWLIASLAFLTSAITGIAVELYFNGLGRIFVGKPALPDISLAHATASGFLEQQFIFEVVKIVYGRTPDIDLKNASIFLRPQFAVLELRNGGWRRPKAWHMTRNVVIPYVATFLTFILAPLTTLAVARKILGSSPSPLEASIQVSFTFAIYTSILLSIVLGGTIRRRIDAWTDIIKDEHFLISTELRNYGSQDERETEAEVANTLGASTDDPVRGQEVRFAADGPLPDVILNAPR